MPLFIPNRPSGTFTPNPNRRAAPGQGRQEGQRSRANSTDYLQLYPLEMSQNRQAHRAGPPTPRRQPEERLRPPSVVPEYTMAPPVMRGRAAPDAPRNPIGQTLPQHMAAQGGMPHHGQRNASSRQDAEVPAAPMTQEQAAQFFRRANKSLPDGVRYEPLDDATMRLLREHGHLPPEEPKAVDQQAQMQAPSPQIPSTQMQAPLMPGQGPVPNPGAMNLAHQSPVPMPQAMAPPMPAPAGPHLQHPTMPHAHQPAAIPQDSKPTAKIIEGLIQYERNAHVFYSSLAKVAEGQTTEPVLTTIANDSNMYTSHFSHMLLRQFGSNFAPAETEINTGLGLKESLALALEEENKSMRILTELLENVANTESEKLIQRVINRKIVNYNQLERLHSYQ